MSQTTDADDGASSSEATDGDVTAMAVSAQVERLADVVDMVTEHEVSTMSDERIADLWSALKNLESQIEDARKDVVGDEIEDRIEPGERLCGVSRIQSHRKYVVDDAGSVIGRAASQGVDYTDFVDLNASTLADEHPDLAEIGRHEYTYLR